MATAFKEMPMGEVKGKRVHLSLPALTFIEQLVLDICIEAAESGAALPSNDEIARRIGATGVSTVPGVLLRLEQKGYINREVYQRGRRVCIEATGKCTLPPPCTVPHWRTISDRSPVPAIHMVRQRDLPFSQWIETTARRLGRDTHAFMQELMARGRRDFEADEAEGEL